VKRALHIVLVLTVAAACQGPRTIPKDTLVDIYTDMFLADQVVREENIQHYQMDSVLLYEAVFEKYGYDTDDFMFTLRKNLRDPERFAKVLEAVTKRLEGKVNALDKVIEIRNGEADERAIKRPLLDSILAPFSRDSIYRGRGRVVRDTSRYPIWFRVVALQEDTLMIPVDSLEARAARDTLKKKEEKPALEPAKPTITLPKPMSPDHHVRVRERTIVATEEVVEEAVEEAHEQR
jgi:hypothetical protein